MKRQNNESIETLTPGGTGSLGERVKAVRAAWGWSQEAMAEALRVDQASVSFWERGKIRPSGSAMLALAALFRTTVETLESGEGFKIPTAPLPKHNSGSNLELPRTVSLPPTHPGDLTLVDLKDGSARGMSRTEAPEQLGQAIQEVRRIWLVME